MTQENDGTMGTPTELASAWLQTTAWTLSEAAAKEEAVGAARRQVFARYYRPVCAYIAAITRDPDSAEDHAHDFFLLKVFKVEGDGLLEKADRKGKFRPYLKAAVRNFLKDHWKQQNWRQERGERPDAEVSGWDGFPGGDLPDAEDVFHVEWAKTLLYLALEKVRVKCEAAGQDEYLAIFLARFASDDAKPPSWEEIGARFGLNAKLARRRADTVQRRFRAALREVLIEEEGSSDAADEELATLLAVLRS